MQVAPSTTRAAILIRYSLRVTNSARNRAERFGHGLTCGEHTPIGGCVENQGKLVGARIAPRGAVAGKLGRVQLDDVLHLAAGTADGLIEIFCAAPSEVTMSGMSRPLEVASRRATRGRSHLQLLAP